MPRAKRSRISPLASFSGRERDMEYGEDELAEDDEDHDDDGRHHDGPEGDRAPQRLVRVGRQRGIDDGRLERTDGDHEDRDHIGDAEIHGSPRAVRRFAVQLYAPCRHPQCASPRIEAGAENRQRRIRA